MKAHLSGGIPCAEIFEKKNISQKWHFNVNTLFPKYQNENEGYTTFAESIMAKEDIRPVIVNENGVIAI